MNKCQWEDAYDDMYPEFAPDPIVVRCSELAPVRVEGNDPDGAGGRDEFVANYCYRHAAQLLAGIVTGSDPMPPTITGVYTYNEPEGE